jgi:hypothetical protein
MKGIKFLLILLLISMPLSAFGAQEAVKAKTVDELAKMYDVSSCKKCHEDIYKEWE